MSQISLFNNQSSISSSGSVSQVGNMSLRNDQNDVYKMIQFLKSNAPRKNNENRSPAATRSSKQSKVNNCENKFIVCLQSISCLNFQDTLRDRETTVESHKLWQ